MNINNVLSSLNLSVNDSDDKEMLNSKCNFKFVYENCKTYNYKLLNEPSDMTPIRIKLRNYLIRKELYNAQIPNNYVDITKPITVKELASQLLTLEDFKTIIEHKLYNPTIHNYKCTYNLSQIIQFKEHTELGIFAEFYVQYLFHVLYDFPLHISYNISKRFKLYIECNPNNSLIEKYRNNTATLSDLYEMFTYNNQLITDVNEQINDNSQHESISNIISSEQSLTYQTELISFINHLVNNVTTKISNKFSSFYFQTFIPQHYNLKIKGRPDLYITGENKSIIIDFKCLVMNENSLHFMLTQLIIYSVLLYITTNKFYTYLTIFDINNITTYNYHITQQFIMYFSRYIGKYVMLTNNQPIYFVRKLLQPPTYINWLKNLYKFKQQIIFQNNFISIDNIINNNHIIIPEDNCIFKSTNDIVNNKTYKLIFETMPEYVDKLLLTDETKLNTSELHLRYYLLYMKLESFKISPIDFKKAFKYHNENGDFKYHNKHTVYTMSYVLIKDFNIDSFIELHNIAQEINQYENDDVNNAINNYYVLSNKQNKYKLVQFLIYYRICSKFNNKIELSKLNVINEKYNINLTNQQTYNLTINDLLHSICGKNIPDEKFINSNGVEQFIEHLYNYITTILTSKRKPKFYFRKLLVEQVKVLCYSGKIVSFIDINKHEGIILDYVLCEDDHLKYIYYDYLLNYVILSTLMFSVYKKYYLEIRLYNVPTSTEYVYKLPTHIIYNFVRIFHNINSN